MPNFRPTDRLTGLLMPPSVNEWLPQRHLARFVVEVVDGLDLSAMSKSSVVAGISPSGATTPTQLSSFDTNGDRASQLRHARWGVTGST